MIARGELRLKSLTPFGERSSHPVGGGVAGMFAWALKRHGLRKGWSMLGRVLPSGSEAISFHNTLFRVSELCWIKAVRLRPIELALRVGLVVIGVLWIFAMAESKGTYANVEFLLAAFPFALAWHLSGSLQIGCSGDFEDSYEGRRGAQSEIFRRWIEELRAKEPGWVYWKGEGYEVLLNPRRIAWLRPCYTWQAFPLVVAGVFALYAYVLGLALDLRGYPVIDDCRILIFEGGVATIKLLSWVVIGLCFTIFFVTLRRCTEICGTGGVQDVFPTSIEDQDRLFDLMVGHSQPGPSSDTKAKPKGDKSVTVTAQVADSKALVSGGHSNSKDVQTLHASGKALVNKADSPAPPEATPGD